MVSGFRLLCTIFQLQSWAHHPSRISTRTTGSRRAAHALRTSFFPDPEKCNFCALCKKSTSSVYTSVNVGALLVCTMWMMDVLLNWLRWIYERTFLQIDSRISSWRKSISIFVRQSSRTRPQVERVIPSSPPTLTLTEFFIGWRSMIFCFSAENGGKKRPKIREKLRPNDGVGGGENVRDKKYFFYFVFFCAKRKCRREYIAWWRQRRSDEKWRMGSASMETFTRCVRTHGCFVRQVRMGKKCVGATVKNAYPRRIFVGGN